MKRARPGQDADEVAGARVPDADLRGPVDVAARLAADHRGDGVPTGIESDAARLAAGVGQREEIVVEQALQIVPFPAAMIVFARFGLAIGEALLGTGEVVETPLQLALRYAA